jgi:hypothetical protein
MTQRTYKLINKGLEKIAICIRVTVNSCPSVCIIQNPAKTQKQDQIALRMIADLVSLSTNLLMVKYASS